MTDDDAGVVAGPERPAPRYDVIHVERAFSAQPTLGDALGPSCVVHEMPLPDALACGFEPDLVWASDATADQVHLLRAQFPDAHLLATLPRSAPSAPSATVLELLEEGADLVLRDEGVLLAAAALQALARRRPPRAVGDEPGQGIHSPVPAPAQQPLRVGGESVIASAAQATT